MKPLHWIVLVSLLAVFIAPPTRRAAYEQTRLVLGVTPPEAYMGPPHVSFPTPPAAERRRTEAYRRVAARHPNDIGIAMAAAVEPVPFSMTEFNKGIVANLRPLLVRYPNSPQLYAALLRNGSQCLGEVGDEYKAGKPEFQAMRDAIDPKPARTLPRVSFAEYDAWAAAGERLDPDNAFFPAMRTVSLFEMGQNDAALSAIERAASNPRWDNYRGDLVKGLGVLPREAYGRTDPLVTITSGALFVTFDGRLRESLGRRAVNEALALERAGHAEAGLRLRRNIWRLAKVWRVQSREVVGSMTATAIGTMAVTDLGGRVAVDPKWPGERKRQVQRDAVLAYLTRTGHSSDAEWLRADMAQRDDMRDIVGKGLERADIVGTMTKAMGSWGAAMMLLNAALWLVMLAALVAWVRRATDGRGQRLFIAVLASAVLLAWQGRAQEGWQAASAPAGLPPLAYACLTSAMGALFVPILLSITLGLAALVRRKPFRKSVDAWLRASLIPTACVLAVLFVAVSAWGVKPQRELREFTDGQLTHEGRYYAHLLGKTWPE